MKNFKFFTILTYFFLLQAAAFSANAQCTVTLSAKSTKAMCYNDGTITVTIDDSASKGNINFTSAQFRLDPISGGEAVGLTSWGNDNSASKTYLKAVKGTYTVYMEVFCQSSPGNWTKTTATTTVTVPGNYEPLVTTFTTRRKSMNCKPTGALVVNFTNGKPPYSGTITGPAGYTGPTTFSTIDASLSLGDVCPAGNYNITVKDDCNYGGNYPYFLPALADDVVSTLYSRMMRKSNSSDCNTIEPFSVNTVTDPSESEYWTNFSQYYEYAYTLGSKTSPIATSNEWKTLTTKQPEYVFPNDYKDFCSGSTVFYSHIRPIGSTCTGAIRSIAHDMSYICPEKTNINIFTVSTFNGSTCSTAKLSATVSASYGVCYPANWKITPKSNLNDIKQQGTIANSSQFITDLSSNDFPRGVSYTITLTGNDGREFSCSWEPPAIQGQTFSTTSNYEFSPGAYCMVTYGSITTTGTIATGTKIKYIEGPIQTLPCGLSLNDTYTISASNWNLSSYFYFTNTNPSTTSAATHHPVPYGDYKFEVTNACGVTSTVTCPMVVYGIDPLVYTTKQTCNDGLKVTFNNRIFQLTATGAINYLAQTNYRIIGGPPGYTVDNTKIVSYGSPLTLPTPGTYTIGVLYGSYWNCDMATTTVVYPAGGLFIDPISTAAYACDTSSPGHIRVRAINGVEPYTYTVTSARLTTPISPQTNTTGIFSSIGEAGGTYNINVKDNCNNEFDLQIPMIDLANPNIVYTSNNGKFCNGTEIDLNCVALGQITYEWRGPDGLVFSTEQRPRPIAKGLPGLFTGSSGFYSVTVKPEGCGSPITQSLYIEIGPQLPNVTNLTSSVLINSGNVDLVALSGVTASAGNTLKWYGSATGTTTIPAPTAVSTTTLGSTDYYVSQITASGCESERQKITIIVQSAYNCLRVNPHLRSYFVHS